MVFVPIHGVVLGTIRICFRFFTRSRRTITTLASASPSSPLRSSSPSSSPAHVRKIAIRWPSPPTIRASPARPLLALPTTSSLREATPSGPARNRPRTLRIPRDHLAPTDLSFQMRIANTRLFRLLYRNKLPCISEWELGFSNICLSQPNVA
ncbi:hypothetical protein C8Q78DRAFT_1031989 [Trametes maxima]|nr:hypothetical protein C8Q78DRAFT_1031989 [Trametes maxima]